MTTPNTLPANGGVSDAARVSPEVLRLRQQLDGVMANLAQYRERYEIVVRNCSKHTDRIEELEQLLAQSRPPSTQSGGVVGWVRLDSEGLVFTDKQSTANWWEGQNYKVHAVQLAPPPAGGGKEALSDAERLAFVSNSPSRYVEQHPTNNMWRVYEDKAPATAVAANWIAMTPDYHATPHTAIDAAIRAGKKG